ncbi:MULTISPECIES: 3-oxoacyl-ACP synthase III family protein [unclassified Shewanella]|uniref:3-oxoacyl-ACP synthase III family protein n=1 Tax=unclassified Shewanella TaxID=196818 RepID=UPI0039B3B856
MKAYISCISSYLPSRTLSNEQLSNDYPDWSINKIYSKTGISNRHIASDSETCSDMAVKACENLFLENSIDKDSVDFILLCTQSPDYLLPTTACIVQERLGLNTGIGALDFNLGCSGYIYGLSLAKGIVETGQAKNVLLITSEAYSKYINESDKSVRTLFGDGATATLISAENTQGSQSDFIGPFVFGTDGSGAENLIVPHGGSKFPITEESSIAVTDSSGNQRSPKNLYMNGGEIFTFTLKTVPASVNALLDKAKMTLDDVDYIIFHQANKFMLDQLRKACRIEESKFLTSYESFGNTVSSTIPLGLIEANKAKLFLKGHKIMLIGFGVGYSWAGTIITHA